MTLEDRMKQILGEQAFRIVVLMANVEEMQKRITELEANHSPSPGNGKDKTGKSFLREAQ